MLQRMRDGIGFGLIMSERYSKVLCVGLEGEGINEETRRISSKVCIHC